ncbi:hypothetical protein WNY59_11605 [Ahrensia kielensis]|uniref:Asparagine synthetase domain-containing protein n=1 Tax=Ahrensia kielensis TaxID=76980 RepID=A0ABU9T7Z0_9HYPH
MNITLGVISFNFSKAVLQSTDRLFDIVQDHIHETSDCLASSKQYRSIEDGVWIANECLSGPWSKSPWIETNDELLSFSAPPIPLYDINDLRYQEELLENTKNDRDLNRFLSGHFGMRYDVKARKFKAWADTLGLARCYWVQNERYLAVSNSITPLLYFTDCGVEIDTVEWMSFGGFGWFTGNGSPFREVNRLAAGEVITSEGGKRGTIHKYTEVDDLVRPRGGITKASLAETVEEMSTIACNASKLTTEPPVINLSGGKDSRLTAAVWLSAKKPATIFTNATISGEGDVAKDLVNSLPFKIEDIGVNHNIVSQSVSLVTHDKVEPIPLQERAMHLMRHFDGDAAPIALKISSINRGRLRRLSIGGGGGEIAHGNYYNSPEVFRRVQNLDYTFERIAHSYSTQYGVTDAGKLEIEARLRSWYDQAASLDIDKISRLDFFYLTQRFRRWPLSGADTSALMLYSSPKFVRLAFDATPHQRYDAYIQRELTGSFINQWKNKDYFKASQSDSKIVNRKNLRMWQGSDREWILDTLSYGEGISEIWDIEFIIKRLNEIEAGQGGNWHESVIQRAVWYETFLKHVTTLSVRISKAKKSLGIGP